MSILLLENKEDRRIKYDKNDDKGNIVTFIYGNKECNISLDNFMKDNSSFDDYGTIIIHGSIYGNKYKDEVKNNLFEDLEKYCKDKNKDLVIFSGGFSATLMDGDILTLKPETIFENIKIYINEYKNGQANIMMLGYGKRWELNPLLNTLEKINIYMEDFSEDEFKCKEFKNTTGLKELEIFDIYCNEIKFNDIANLTKEICKKIKEISYE